MSASDSKKAKRRKNKLKNDNSSSKLTNTMSSNLTISKIEQIMDEQHDSPPLLDIANGSNPFFSVDKCLMCQREKDDYSLSHSTDETWDNVGKLPYEISNYTQLPLWICNECKCDIESGEHSKEQVNHLSQINVDNKSDFDVTAAACNCQACYDKRSLKYEHHSRLLDESYSELSNFIRHLYKDGGIDWTEEKNSYEILLLEKLKEMVNRWCVNNSHELFLWLELQVRDHVVELKMNLLTHLRRNGMSPLHSKLFMIDLLEGYARLCCASKRLRPVVQELEKDYLKKLNLSWELINRRLFQTVIYSDERVQNVLPVLIRQLETLEKDDKEQKNVASMLQKYLKLDEQMKIVAVLWAEAEPLIQEFNTTQSALRCKLKSLHDDELLDPKMELFKKCDSGVFKSPCEECTLKYLLTCRLLPNPDSNMDVRTAFSSSVSSMTNHVDSSFIKEQSHCCGNSIELANSFKKVLSGGGDDVKRLAQIMGRVVNCPVDDRHSLLCNCSSSMSPSSEREPGDGASENSTPQHASSKTYHDNLKGQCHACSHSSGATSDHVSDSNSSSDERKEHTCECHICVHHADRATIPSVVSSPLPAALHLYPHIHGTNSEHSLNSHLFKPVLRSHVREVYTSSVSSSKDKTHDVEKSVAKSKLNDSFQECDKLDCCQLNFVQSSKSCGQSKGCIQHVTSETVEVQKTGKHFIQTITSNVSVKTQTQDGNKLNESSCSKCVTHNKAVQATSNVLGWSSSLTGTSHHAVKHVVHNHPSSSSVGNGNSGVQKNADVSCCVNECRHNSSKSSNIRPHISEDLNGTTVIHSCGHHNSHSHSSTTIKHMCRDSRCSFRESQSLSPSRSCSDGDYLRSGDGEDCLDDSCSEQSSSTSTSNNKDAKHCDCCYCEVFGHDVSAIPSTSRNYTEIRDKLRQRLTKKKRECKTMEPEPCESKKGPEEDCRDLDSLISFINGNKVVQNCNSTMDNSPKKISKVLKKLNKKIKKDDAKTETRDADGKTSTDGHHNGINANGECETNHQGSTIIKDCFINDSLAKLSIKNKLSVNGKCKSSDFSDSYSNGSEDNETSLYENESKLASGVGKSESLLSSVYNKCGSFSSVERSNDKKKNLTMNISPSVSKANIMEEKAKVEKQRSVSNFKLNKQLPYQTKTNNVEDMLLAAHGQNYILEHTSQPVWSVARSPSPIIDSVQAYTNQIDKNSSINQGNGHVERTNCEPSPRKYKKVKDKTKNDVVVSQCQTFSSLLNDGLNKINGIQLPSSKQCSSPPPSNQSANCKGRKFKKKCSTTNNPPLIDEVFLPRDIDLENGELDETEKELEAFKRFCWDSVPVPNKEKIRVNFKELNFRKKTIVECN